MFPIIFIAILLSCAGGCIAPPETGVETPSFDSMDGGETDDAPSDSWTDDSIAEDILSPVPDGTSPDTWVLADTTSPDVQGPLPDAKEPDTFADTGPITDAGPTPDCGDNDKCTVDLYNEETGECDYFAVGCFDGLDCTLDICDPLVGCTFPLDPSLPGCCTADADCDDGDPCTLEACESKSCVYVLVPDEACCQVDGDCDDGDPCTSNTCGEDGCTTVEIGAPDCCSVHGDCDDEDPCTVDRCEPQGCVYENTCCDSIDACPFSGDACASAACVDGKCVQELLEEECCTGGIFAQGEPGTVQTGSGSLHSWVSTVNGNGTGSWVYEANTSWNPIEAGPHQGSWLMTEISLPPGARSHVEMELLVEVQTQWMVDHVVLQIESMSGTVPLWTKEFSLGSGWHPVTFDLAAFAGQTVSLRLQVDSVTGDTSKTDRVGIRGVVWQTDCAPLSCTEQECDDGLVTTSEECVSGLCAYQPYPFLCSPVASQGLGCGFSTGCIERSCEGLVCVENTAPGCCESSVDCEDGNPCTEEWCDGDGPGQCVYEKSSECCTTDADCTDDNPCTTLFCHPTEGCLVASTAEDCCTSDEDCEDGNPCTASTCASGLCEQSPICCLSDSDCFAPGHPCLQGTCGAAGCSYAIGDACCEETVAQFSFSSPDALYPWVILTDNDPEDEVKWHLSTALTQSPPFALAYSNPASGTYETGNTGNAGSLESPSFTGEIGTALWVEFDLYLATEFSAGGAPNGDYDRLEVIAVSENQEFSVFRSWELDPQWWISVPEKDALIPAWTGIGPILLPPEPSGTWRLRWTFETLDGAANGYSGVVIDDIRVHQECPDVQL